jgi:hypothetical protein
VAYFPKDKNDEFLIWFLGQSDHKLADQERDAFNAMFHREEEIHREHHETFSVSTSLLTSYFTSQSLEFPLVFGPHILKYIKKCASATKDKRLSEYRARSIMQSLDMTAAVYDILVQYPADKKPVVGTYADGFVCDLHLLALLCVTTRA